MLKMSKKLIDETIKLWGEIPELCRKQVDLQRDHYYRLINQADEYNWDDLFTSGVKIKEKDGDPQIFIAQLANPIKLHLFVPSSDVSQDVNNKLNIKVRSLPPILEEKLSSLGVYLGPIGQKVMSPKGEEFTSPFKFIVNKEDRVVRLVCL